MKSFILKAIISAIIGSVAIHTARAQNNALVLNGAYIKMNGGTSSAPAFLVVNQSSTSGILRNSGHIISENQYNYVRWRQGTGTGSYVYPFGYSTTDYLPVTLNKTTSGSSNMDASTWGTDNKNQPHAGVSDGGTLGATFKMRGVGDSVSSVIDRWWDFYPSGALTANLTFSYRGAENATTTNTGDNLDMQHWNGHSWDPPITGSTTGVTSGVGTLSVSGVTSFSPMVIVHRSGPLPVTIKEFNLQCTATGVVINWVTGTEFNSDYFNVERSDDGKYFIPIAKIKAAGKSTMPLHYSFTDYSGLTSTAYYRLKEVDFDGKTDYSENVLYSDCTSASVDGISIYPNPVSDFINYKSSVQIKEGVTIKILDQAGQPVIQEKHATIQDSVIPSTDVSMLNEGFYFARISYEQKVFLVKFIKVKK